MTYEPTTPSGPGENPSVSQPKITSNFEDISLLVNVNHVNFNDSNQGKHKFVTMPEQTAAPANLENEGAVYTKEFDDDTQLFWRNEDDGSEQQMTNSVPNAADRAQAEWNFADGFQTRFGRVTVDSSFIQVTFLTPFDVAPYSVQITPVGASGGGNWNIQAVLNTGFRIHNTIDGDFYYMAIGTG